MQNFAKSTDKREHETLSRGLCKVPRATVGSSGSQVLATARFQTAVQWVLPKRSASVLPLSECLVLDTTPLHPSGTAFMFVTEPGNSRDLNERK